MSSFQDIWIRFTRQTASREDSNGGQAPLFGWKKTGVFGLAILLAFFLWFMVNMGREYSVTLELPVEVRNISEETALSGELPEQATVSMSGEGWALLNYYNNPPKIQLDGSRQQQVNMLEEVRSLFGNASNISVKQVIPPIATIQTEEKRSLRVPVRSRVDVSVRERYGTLSEPVLRPDSITVTGAASQVEGLTEWVTEPAEIANLDESVTMNIPLSPPESGMVLSVSQVEFFLPVAEFTEAEVRVPVEIRNAPLGKMIEINPSIVTLRFDIPIEEYTLLQNLTPYTAFVDYLEILQDDSGLVTPQVEVLTEELHVRFKSAFPSRISYYNVIPQ